jgi:hypothetical protein
MFWGIVLAIIASIILGFAWYGPLFGKQWMKLMGITQKQMKAAQKKGMPKSTYLWMILGSLITSLVVNALFPMTSWAAIKMAAMVWLGFIAPVLLSSVLWEGRPWKLYIINLGYYLVNLVAMSLIIAAFN